MYTETEYQKKIIAAKNDIGLRCIVRRSFAVVFFGWVFVNYINFGFAQTENTTVEGNSKNNTVRKINVQKPQPEAKYHIVYHTKNLVPLPFNNPRFKPVYTGTISQEDSEKTRKAITMMLEKSKSSNPLTNILPTSKFYLKKKRQNIEAKHNIVYYTKNLVPLPFNNTRFNPVYTGTISPDDSKKTRKAMTMMLEKSISSNPLTNILPTSKFYLKEKRQNTEAKHNIVYHTKNLVPLPFNNPRFKPVYTGTISPEDSKKTRKAMTMMLEKSISSNPLTNNLPTSKFYLKEQRQNTEAKYNIVYYTKNLAPLPFNNTRFKPVYTGTISPEDSEKTRKAMTMMLEKSKSSNPLTKMMSSSKFYLKEQKQKDREKHKREIQVYNERNNKKFNEYFKRLQQKRSHSANYTGRHFDYTSYNQNIQVAASR